MPPSSRKRSHHHIDDDSDMDIKVIPFKKRFVNYSVEEEEVKTIKIVHQSSSVSEMVMCDICSVSLMPQYLDRHMKGMHSDETLVCNECGVVKDSRKKMRDHKRLHLKLVCHKCGKEVSKFNSRRHLKLCKLGMVISNALKFSTYSVIHPYVVVLESI